MKIDRNSYYVGLAFGIISMLVMAYIDRPKKKSRWQRFLEVFK